MMVPKMTKTKAKKYLAELQKMRLKVITITRFSQQIGIVESVLREEFALFDPMVRMDETYNLLQLLTEIEHYLEQPLNKTVKSKPRKRSKETYEGIGDFIYRNFTVPGGIVDQHVVLSDAQLRDLRRIVLAEIKHRKTQKEG